MFVRRRFYSTVKEYDLIVVGGGPGGYVAAIKGSQLGLKTLCVEGRGKLGGTCLNVGCIPSKSLLHNSHYYHVAKHEFSKRGIETSDLKLNLGQMMKQKEKSVSQLTMGIEGLFKKNKTEYAKGWASLVSPKQVLITGQDGKTTMAVGKNILIATGSEVAGFPGINVSLKVKN